MSSGERKPYTYDEVAQHNTIASMWFVIRGEVYDMTKFLGEVSLNRLHLVLFVYFLSPSVQHPGGEEVLLWQAGEFFFYYIN